MLPSAIQNQLIAGYRQAIDLAAQPCTYVSSRGDPGGPVVAAIASPSKADQNIVNAYGIEIQIITVRADQLEIPPVKFDAFVFSGKRYVAQAVHDVRINATLVGWKVYAKGGK